MGAGGYCEAESDEQAGDGGLHGLLLPLNGGGQKILQGGIMPPCERPHHRHDATAGASANRRCVPANHGCASFWAGSRPAGNSERSGNPAGRRGNEQADGHADIVAATGRISFRHLDSTSRSARRRSASESGAQRRSARRASSRTPALTRLPRAGRRHGCQAARRSCHRGGRDQGRHAPTVCGDAREICSACQHDNRCARAAGARYPGQQLAEAAPSLDGTARPRLAEAWIAWCRDQDGRGG